MRKNFKIMYPQDHPDEDRRGKQYQPPSECMVVMNSKGIFFQYCGIEYYPYIVKLSDVLPKYDVVWSS